MCPCEVLNQTSPKNSTRRVLEMLENLQRLYKKDKNVSQEEVEEPCYSSSEPKSMNLADNEKKRRTKSKKVS